MPTDPLLDRTLQQTRPHEAVETKANFVIDAAALNGGFSIGNLTKPKENRMVERSAHQISEQAYLIDREIRCVQEKNDRLRHRGDIFGFRKAGLAGI